MSGLDDEPEGDFEWDQIEIVEQNIAVIELAASTTFNRSFTPLRGEVKWFNDELDQFWVKFYTVRGIGQACRVWPADRVVEVIYEQTEKED